MMQRDNPGFCCPICGCALTRETSGAVCENGHRFDRARQGYLHLLPANKMHSKIPGDTKEMVAARRQFLEAGYYRAFQEKLCELVSECVGNLPTDKPVVLDAGCGEGYYTAAVKERLPDAEVFGFDISKSAVKAAAGKYKGISFAVASSFAVPVGDGFCDILMDVFSPLCEGEFARVLKPGGYFIYAVPGERHLMGLKEILYESTYENEEKHTEYPDFSFVKRVPVRGEIHVPDAEMGLALFSMTPYYWKTGVDGAARLRETAEFDTEIQFDFLVYRREGNTNDF